VCLASALTFGLLSMMIGLVDGSGIVKRLIWLYPLTQALPCPGGECSAALPDLPAAITIEGTVGHLAAGRIVPLGSAQVVAERPNGKVREVEVDTGGRFRFVTAWPSDPQATPSAESRRGGTASTQLILRAPGCTERRVPVTRAWTPRPILLSCGEGS
jgi:hypothetical protein